MSRSVNVVVVSGNLTRDPETRKTGVGTGVCTFTIAVNRKYKDKESVSFIKITAWAKLGEVCQQYLFKGSGVIVSGRIEQERWEDNDGNAKERTGVVAADIQFLTKKEGGHKPESVEEEEQLSDDDSDLEDLPFTS